MDKLSKEYILSFFDRTHMLHGDRPEAVRWSEKGQRSHYSWLLDIGDLHDRQILDYGCGIGDLYGFLRKEGIRVKYTGTDINPRLIETARKKYPDADFKVLDIAEDEVGETFDYVLLCGVFNLKVPGLEDEVRLVLPKLFQTARIGLAFNALSSYNPRKDFDLQYFSPDDLLRFAVRELSPHVALRHDRMAYDFTLFVYRHLNDVPELP